MSTDPDQIRREIEATRSSLSTDVDALAYKVSPSRIVDDRKQRARNALQNVRDKVMGSASDLGHGTGHAAHSVGDHASSAAASDAVKEKFGEVASELKEELREPAQHATQSVKSTAQDAVYAVKDDATSAAHDVKDTAQQSRDQAGY
jgi:gas vesicle protein